MTSKTPKFKVGDAVMLNSGGPRMTVERVTEYETTTHVRSRYIGENDKAETFEIDQACLKAVPDSLLGHG